VEGLCHVSEVERLSGGSLAEEFPKGRQVRCRLIRLDFAERRIGLSLRGISQPESPASLPEEAPEAQAEELQPEATPELTNGEKSGEGAGPEEGKEEA
jgi:small subunit ribosomal protein S1